MESEKSSIEKIMQDIANLKPEVAKSVIQDKLRNSAVASEIESGDIDNQIENSAYVLKKAMEQYSYVLETNYNLYLYVVARSIFDDVQMPYASY